MKFNGLSLLFTLFTTAVFAQFKSPDFKSNSHHFELSSGVSEKDYVANTIIFRVKDEYRNSCALTEISGTSLNQTFSALGAYKLSKKFPNHQAPNGQKNKIGQKLVDLSLIYEFKYTAAVSIEKACNLLLKSGMLEFAEPHYLPHIDYQPNDPQSTASGQYHLNKISAYSAWDISKGDTNVVIGITDTGTEPTHVDLFANIKHNYADPIDGFDNDNDGYKDNYTGWDVGMNDNDPTWEGSAHGVHVSGCAAASTDNLTGVAGVGFKCKFLPVKIADESGALISAYEGIIYAADHGCDIINCSWGGGGGGQFGQTTIDYATINRDALVVCAAGNDNVSSTFYPSGFNNAFSVASTTSNDNKSSFSNYGYGIDVCAPGSNINATWTNNSYTQLSGTSMASPITAGAAALVKTMFPQFMALQIGEQLKATCDPITASTLGVYAGKLGKGRINLFQGATSTNAKSVTMLNRNVTDGNDDVYVGNDTLKISGDFVNFLSPLSNLVVTLSSTSPYVNILNPSYPIGAMSTLQQVSNGAAPFLVKLNPGAPANVAVTFKANFTDGSYSFNYFFIVVINVDYINVTVNDISTSITSKGRIGFNSESQADGLGFTYKNGHQLLYEAGLMIGTSGNEVSDMVRGANTGSTDNDFSSIQSVKRTLPSAAVSDMDLSGIFNDVTAGSPIGVRVKHKAFAWNTPGNTKYVIVEYKMSNTTSSTLSNLYAGIFADWDIDDSSYNSNRAEFDAANRMGYSYYTGTNGLYVGIQLLSNTAPVTHYAVDNVAGGAGGVDLTDGNSESEKYITLSTDRAIAGATGSGTDIIDVVSSGPFTISPGDSATVAFALLAGDSLTDLQVSAINAQIKYDSILPLNATKISAPKDGFELFPNPAKNKLFVSFAKPTDGVMKLFNFNGQEVYTNNLTAGSGKQLYKIELGNLAQGIYFLQVVDSSGIQTRKVVIE